MNSYRPVFKIAACIKHLCHTDQWSAGKHIRQGERYVLRMSRGSVRKSHSPAWKNHDQLLTVITSYNSSTPICCYIARNANITERSHIPLDLEITMCSNITKQRTTAVHIKIPV